MNIHDPRFKIALFIYNHGLKIVVACFLVSLALVIADELALSWVFTLPIVFMAFAQSWTAKRYLEPVAQQIDDLFNAPGEDAIERFKSSATEFGVLGAFEDELDKLETVDFEGLNGAMERACQRVRGQSFSELAGAALEKAPSADAAAAAKEIKTFRNLTLMIVGITLLVTLLVVLRSSDLLAMSPFDAKLDIGIPFVDTLFFWMPYGVIAMGVLWTIIGAFMWRAAYGRLAAVRIVESQHYEATEYEIRQLRELVEEEGGKVSVFDAHLRTCERPLIRRDIIRAHMLAMGND